MRGTVFLIVALLGAAPTAVSADNWQRLECSGNSEGAGSESASRPFAMRLTLNITTMTWWSAAGGNENNVLSADDRDFYLATVDRLNENDHTEYSLNKATLGMEDENTGAIYRCRKEGP